jgi:rubrerythrin
MKKILLITLPLVLLGMKFEQTEEIKPNKEELLVKQVVYPAAQCTASLGNQIVDEMNHEGALYIHCSTCGYGVFLGDEGHEKCTYCGVKKHYDSRK